MGFYLKIIGIFLSLAGGIFAGLSLVGFPESDPHYTKNLQSLLLIAASLIASACGEIATQLKRRADAADEANRIAERRLNIEAATLASNAAPKS